MLEYVRLIFFRPPFKFSANNKFPFRHFLPPAYNYKLYVQCCTYNLYKNTSTHVKKKSRISRESKNGISRVTEIEKRNSREIRELCHRRFESHEKHVTDVSRDTETQKSHSRDSVYVYVYVFVSDSVSVSVFQKDASRRERDFQKKERERFSPFWGEFWVRVRKRN